jgi:hypothetical protein
MKPWSNHEDQNEKQLIIAFNRSFPSFIMNENQYPWTQSREWICISVTTVAVMLSEKLYEMYAGCL